MIFCKKGPPIRLCQNIRQNCLIFGFGRLSNNIWHTPTNKVLMATNPPIDPAEQLMPQSYRSALFQLHSGYCLRLQSYCHSVGWTNLPTCPDCCSADHSVTHLFICPTHATDLAPGDMWVAPLQVAQFLTGLPHFRYLAPLQIDLDSFPS